MSTRFPAVTAKQIIRVLLHLGFKFSRQAGTSHAIYFRASDGKRTVVPIHAGITLKRKTIKAILADIGITVEELRKLL